MIQRISAAIQNDSFREAVTRVAIAYFDAGGGHRAAALALQSVLTGNSGWDVRLLNLQEYLDPLDPAHRLFGIRIQDIYNRLLNRGSTALMRKLLPVLHAAVRVSTPLIARRLEAYWRQTQPDIVISVVPNLNRAIARSVAGTIPKAAFITLLTDLADTPPHFWIENESQFLICGTQRAVEQALAMGHSPDRIFRTSGMILHPRFYAAKTRDKADLRANLGLDPNLTTVLVMFGGQGSREMVQIANSLNECSGKFQVIYICGHNEALRRQLEALQSRPPRLVVGFTSEVPTYMAASDLMIGKPGPGSVSEALHFSLPVIVTRNASTMPQEVYNTYWIEEKGVGTILRDFRGLAQHIDGLLQEDGLRRMKVAALKQENNAIFEIPSILDRALQIVMERAYADGSSGSVHGSTTVLTPSTAQQLFDASANPIRPTLPIATDECPSLLRVLTMPRALKWFRFGFFSTPRFQFSRKSFDAFGQSTDLLGGRHTGPLHGCTYLFVESGFGPGYRRFHLPRQVSHLGADAVQPARKYRFNLFALLYQQVERAASLFEALAHNPKQAQAGQP
jgi:Glycosyltransferase family 28 C-terminal domain